MTIQATQWTETLQHYLHSYQSTQAEIPPEATPAIQTETLRPGMVNATLAANHLNNPTIRPTKSNGAVTAIRPSVNTQISTQISTIAVKDQFKAGVLNRPLINAIDTNRLQQSQLAIQAKPQWTIAARQVYRQIPPVPKLSRPVTVGDFLLFPDPVWDRVQLTVSDALFVKQPIKDYVVVDQDKIQNIQNIQNIQLQSRNINPASLASVNPQLIAHTTINQATVSQINITALYRADLLQKLQMKQGQLRVRRAFFASTQPWMKEFRLTVQREEQRGTIQTTGGTACLTVSLYSRSDSKVLGTHRSIWTDALEEAGYGTHLWKFIPVDLWNLEASLDLPPGCSMETSADVEDGTITLVIQLSATVAQAWRQALESRNPHLITGTCHFQADYYSRDNDRLRRDRQQLSVSLPTLLQDCTPEVVQLLDPALAMTTAIEVRGSSMVEQVRLDWTPNTDAAPIRKVFNAAGGTLIGTVTATDINKVVIDWQAQVEYKMAGWQTVSQAGKLSASLLREIVKPSASDWVQQITLFSAFMVGRNQVAMNPEELIPFEDIEVEATLTLSAAALTVPLTTTMTLGNTEITQIPFPALPNAADRQIGLAVTTKSPVLNQVLHSQEITLQPSANLVNIKIDTDGRIIIQPDTAPISESSIDAEILTLLGSFAFV